MRFELGRAGNRPFVSVHPMLAVIMCRRPRLGGMLLENPPRLPKRRVTTSEDTQMPSGGEGLDEVDVLVVGYGAAGAAAALAAHDAGARVLIVEKCPQPGGNSLVSSANTV